MGEGQRDGVGAVRCRAVVLATGGMGQVFSPTTNPAVSTGDGVALALRAGATLRDLEFVQFHPTVLCLGPESPRPAAAGLRGGARRGRLPRRRRGRALHAGPARAGRPRAARRRRQGDHAPDARDRHAAHVAGRPALRRASCGSSRFPTILAACRAHGIDPVTELIPVAPGLPLRLRRRRAPTCAAASTCPGLYACGEVACTGVHGANRLASNSLLEGLVFARRIADGAARRAARRWSDPAPDPRTARPGVRRPCARELQEVMTTRVGVLRSADGPGRGRRRWLDKLGRRRRAGRRRPGRLGGHQPATVSAALAAAARAARGDPRLALARGLPRARRRAAAPATSTRPTRPTVRPRRWRSYAGRRPSDGADRVIDRPHARCDAAAGPPLRDRARPTPGSTRRRDRRRDRRARSRRTCRRPDDDVTSVATVPADGPRHGRLRRPRGRRGRRARRSPRWSSTRAGRRRRRSPTGCPTATGSPPATSCCGSPGRPAACSPPSAPRSTCLPPVRRRDRHRALGGRARGHRRAGPRHPQDAARAARAGEVRGALRRRRQPPVRSRDAALVKDNHVVAAGGVVPALRGGAGGVPRTCRSRSRSTASTSCARCSTPAAT